MRPSIEVENSPFLAPNEYALGNHDLPIAAHRTEIENAILENPVTILVGRTGSGKTTQVPQYACELTHDNGRRLFDEIIVTQPRIVAARTLSERVAEEIGYTERRYRVGYYTGRGSTEESQRWQDIAFLTDGKAAIQLLHRGKLPAPDTNRVLIIDEVHERNENIDLLLAIATEKTDPQSKQYDPKFRVVIMSATIDAPRLQRYLTHAKPPIVEVMVPTHKVTKTMTDRSVASVALGLAEKTQGKVLAIVPGKGEIKQIMKVANARPNNKTQVIALHGQQNAAEQHGALREYDEPVVVAGTNVVESSLTIADALAVADSGEYRVDRVTYDLIATGSEGLYLEPASRASLDQRAGRVGRTAPGRYVLCSPDGKTPTVPYEDRPEFATPAIERTRLDSLLLRLKATNHEVSDFRFFDKPPVEALRAAHRRLFVLGALDEEGKITDRGLQMEALPLNPEYACMVAFAYEKDYPKEVKEHVIDIAAIMQLGGILKRAPDEDRWRELLAKNIYDEVRETESDFIAQLDAYIQLTTNVSRDDWGRYDIIENAADQVEQSRKSLMERLGARLHQPSHVEASSRQAVMTCINAGQLNQIWRRRGNTWSWVLGNSEAFELSDSSVVTNLGELVTGKLFSLGLRKKIIDQIQDANTASLHSLEQAASHLLTETVDHSTVTYDADRECVVASVHRKLGSIVLGSVVMPIEVASDSASKLLREGYRKHAWDTWDERAGAPTVFNSEMVKAALENPRSAEYGMDPVSGEPLIAWMGGNGQWCQTKEVAIKSLEACKRRLEKAPGEADRRAQKDAARKLETELRALKKGGNSNASQATRLLAAKKKTPRVEWLEEVKRFVENSSAS